MISRIISGKSPQGKKDKKRDVGSYTAALLKAIISAGGTPTTSEKEEVAFFLED